LCSEHFNEKFTVSHFRTMGGATCATAQIISRARFTLGKGASRKICRNLKEKVAIMGELSGLTPG
jgi:hypothetical protein